MRGSLGLMKTLAHFCLQGNQLLVFGGPQCSAGATGKPWLRASRLPGCSARRWQKTRRRSPCTPSSVTPKACRVRMAPSHRGRTILWPVDVPWKEGSEGSRRQCTLPSVGLELLPGCRCLLPPLVAAAGSISRGDCTSASNQGGPWSSELLARTCVPERPPLSSWFLLFWEGSGMASEPVLKALHFWFSDHTTGSWTFL